MRRYTQDSPVQPDVWVRFLKLAGRKQLDVKVSLILAPKDTPTADGQPAGPAALLAEDIRRDVLGKPRDPERAKIPQEKQKRIDPVAQLKVKPEEEIRPFRLASSGRTVAIEVTFSEMLRYLIPKTFWWTRVHRNYRNPKSLGDLLNKAAEKGLNIQEALMSLGDTEFFRFVALCSIVSLAGSPDIKDERVEEIVRILAPDTSLEIEDAAELRQEREKRARVEVNHLTELWLHYSQLAYSTFWSGDARKRPKRRADNAAAAFNAVALIWAIHLNRVVQPQAVSGTFVGSLGTFRSPARASSQTVKADAAITLFGLTAKDLTWAIIDTGIDANHPAFRRTAATGEKTAAKGKVPPSRVVGTLDFTRLRDLLAEEFDVTELVKKIPWNLTIDPGSEEGRATRVLATIDSIRRRNVNGRELDWTLLEPLIRMDPADAPVPADPHGTHVAGILGGGLLPNGVEEDTDPFVGVCPDIQLYDLRVFSDEAGSDEFTILTAIDYVSWINRDPERPMIHGVNVSLATPHVVDQHACGRTPVCESCNRLVASGTVVVAAAGNAGFDNKQKLATRGTGYRGTSITDPGNAEDVITVGATHRNDPHTYGVSYFSSRGPTGDGRMKPDLVAPGEKIRSACPGGKMLIMDGTSMAAPHVSGVCALLMARHREFIGHPRRIKDVLVRTATDIGRERSFQGAGLVDALRALQSI